MAQKFPNNPMDGDVFEQERGIFSQYDAATKTWVTIAVGDGAAVATGSDSGNLSATDLRKLNRLLLPPPQASLIGTDCVTPFRSGVIALNSADEFISVSGAAPLQNINETGDLVKVDSPFKINSHTYGFDFKLDFQKLFDYIDAKGRVSRPTGGPHGNPGKMGAPGTGPILAGPPGDQGTQGSSPPCRLAVNPESFAVKAKTNADGVLTKVEVVDDVDDPTHYHLVFTRQAVGTATNSASTFKVADVDSTWALAVGGAGNTQTLYYLDLQTIVETISDQYKQEVAALKSGYEQVVRFWIQTMSNLFDEQKAALCCALEHCISVTKSTGVRQHIESVAAAAVGKADIELHDRHSPLAVQVPSTRLLQQTGGADLCPGGPVYPQQPFVPQVAQAAPQAAPLMLMMAMTPKQVTIDPLLHSSLMTALRLELPAGDYQATIKELTASVDGLHRGDVKIQHVVTTQQNKIIQFINKDAFVRLLDAQDAYHNLTIAFHHAGGPLALWLPAFNRPNVHGTIKIEIAPQTVVATQASLPCALSVAAIARCQESWRTSACCGVVMTLANQDYIIMASTDLSVAEPCFAAYIAPAFAFPTFNDEEFVLSDGADQRFILDKELNDLAAAQLASGNYRRPTGIPVGQRLLLHKLSTILFPIP